MPGTFETRMDAVWSAFRLEMLEAYEHSSDENISGLRARIASLEQELGDRPTLSDVKEPFCHPSLETPKILSIRPQMVEAEEPPVKEEVFEGPDVELTLPDPTRCSERLLDSYGPVEESTPDRIPRSVSKKNKSSLARGSSRRRRNSSSRRSSALSVTPLASQRVRMRLGSCAYTTLIPAQKLADALFDLGLRGYLEEDMEALMNQLADYIDLQFTRESKTDEVSKTIEIDFAQKVDLDFDVPSWRWPEESQQVRRSWAMDFKAQRQWNVCPTDALVDLLTEPDPQVAKRIFGPRTRKQFETIRDLLQRWDPNDLVKEITQAKAANLPTDVSEGSEWSFNLLSSTEAQAIRQRLRVRLGAAVTAQRLVSGRNLHSAMEALGLTSYTVENMNDLVNSIADYIDLRFEEMKTENYKRSNSPLQGVFNFDFEFQEDDTNGFGPPSWQWPERFVSGSGNVAHLHSTSVAPSAFEGNQIKCQYNVVPLQALMDLFMFPDHETHRKMFNTRLLTQFEAMREILLAGDTNRLVAELTFVRINDLAAPPEPMGVLLFMEPFVALLIIANGIMIGFQTHPDFEAWEGWPWLELTFVVALVLENVLRIRLLGVRLFFCGNDRLFNWFDFFLSFTGLADLCISYFGEESDMLGVSLLRFCRLIRLVRVVKVFRLRCMKELRLMVKGLVAGFRTLCLSFVLLIAVLYVISGFATMTIGSDPRTSEIGLMPHFKTIPEAMFTAFLCFAGECIDTAGRPIHTLIANEFGLPFVMGYVMSYMLVSMGIFNVILAVYVDITMKAAKENDAMTAEQHARESIRIARTTRELLKKFAAAYRLYQDLDNIDKMPQLDFSHGAAPFTDNDIHAQIAITKELFLLVIQDRCVQRLMDELDLPPDRANLFEAIDADGSGTLHVTELVQGLLQIRGEVKKSDAVATLLSTKALQNMVTEMREELNANMEHLQDFIKAEIQTCLDLRHGMHGPPPKSLMRQSLAQLA